MQVGVTCQWLQLYRERNHSSHAGNWLTENILNSLLNVLLNENNMRSHQCYIKAT